MCSATSAVLCALSSAVSAVVVVVVPEVSSGVSSSVSPAEPRSSARRSTSDMPEEEGGLKVIRQGTRISRLGEEVWKSGC